MRPSKNLVACVQFARFCQEHAIEPRCLAELIALARRAYLQGVKSCNEPGHEAATDKAYQAFEAAAKELGFQVDWPGLYPCLMKDGKTIYLPAID